MRQQPDDDLTKNIKQAAKKVFFLDPTVSAWIVWPLLLLALIGWYYQTLHQAILAHFFEQLMASTMDYPWLTLFSILMVASLAVWQIYRHFPDSLFAAFNLLMIGIYEWQRYQWTSVHRQPYLDDAVLIPFHDRFDVYLLIFLLTVIQGYLVKGVKWYFYIIGGLGYAISLQYIALRLGAS